MLATGLSADDALSYIEGVTSAKVTIACINSPKSVTLSGDVSTIDELHCRLEENGVFSRRLNVNVAYHSVHMKAFAEEYSRLIRGLSVQPRHQGVDFYSSVYPGIPVETNAEYWVQNLLSPVRFSEAMKAVLDSQSETDLACIEIGPHSALAGPFRQICQSLLAESRAEYFPSILRNQNGVEQALNLACNLFTRGWKIDLASINFPVGGAGLRVLTDLPPYAWNRSTQHWHEGRLAHNYRHRTTPPHDLLGTLSDDSSDLDMRWTRYVRQSEHPWLKDHVIKSEVILPGAAYLVMAMEAVNQKASISGLEIQGYTLRNVTFSRALVVPDTSDGIEISLILEPFRQSSAASSTTWNEFRVTSFGPHRKAYEHCHGLISITHKPNFHFYDNVEATLATMRHDKAMKPGFYEEWLSRTSASGNQMGPSLRLISESCLKNEHVFCNLRIPERSDHESPVTVSVPLMDSFIQAAFFALSRKNEPIDGAIIPTSIAEMAIAASIDRYPGHMLHCRGSTAKLGPRDYEGRVIVARNIDDTLEPVVDGDDPNNKLYWDELWNEDPDGLSQEDVAKRWPTSEQTPREIIQTVLCEKAAWYCLRSAYDSLTDEDVGKLAPHHRHYHDWMKKRYQQGQDGLLPLQKNNNRQDWSSSDQRAVENTIQQVAATGVHGRMTVLLGRQILSILRGEVQPLSLMIEDDLLNQYYAEDQAQDRVYEHAARYVRLTAHKNPQLKVLEIGAGTGSATSWILGALGGHGTQYPQFSSYVFTDISTGFFEKAQTKFRAWGSLITYKSLNIEEDLKAQGFDETEGYDIVVAANVLHATHNMDHTMSQASRLLRPGGKLILVETSPDRQIHRELVFGLLPGWWMGVAEGRKHSPLLSETQWASLMKRTGYSGLDICLRDSLNVELWTMSMMITTKKDHNAGSGPLDAHIVYDTSQAKGILWITFGGSGNTNNAGAGAVTGITRTLRSENGGMNYLTCDIAEEDSSQPELIQAICRLFVKAFSKFNMSLSERDFEYAVRNGRVMIPRLVEDKLANKAIMTKVSKHEPEDQALWQENSYLCLNMGHIGLLDTFRFVHSDRCSNEIQYDEVEIEVKTVGLNFRDLMVATGQLPDPNGYGLECAGVVAKLGKTSHRLNVGDRVCALAPGSFANRVRANEKLVSKLPDSMTFETGASIPGVFTTMYFSIHHAARLRRNETILIHSAAGGTGQAGIKFAQLIGANIFVTVGSSTKADFLEKTYGLPRSHILNSRTLKFASEIMVLTEGRGVDVIINSLAGDALHESWKCLAMFGRFIELGKKDAVENARLEMAKFERSTSYICVGWNHFMDHRPETVSSVLNEVMALSAKGTLTPLGPITTFPMSAIESAFRFMASGTHMGKIVVTADRDCLVKAIPKPPPPFQLRAEASYLIVGGLGGIGIEIAKWMVHELGAKSLILISRSGMDAPGASDAVDSLRRPGVVIIARKCDVADKDSLSAVLQECLQALPPIRGVVQGAMVLKDAIFPNLTLTKYYQALDPKIRGSQNLHDLFQQSPSQLDFFVMLSSLGGILGNASQSNYAAGNTFQDALANHRVSQGLPALTIDVGKVVDAGWVAQNPDSIRRGVLAQARDIRVKDLTALIEHHVRAWSTGTGSVAAQVAVGIREYPAYDARFSHILASLRASAQQRETQDQKGSLESQIVAASHDSTRLLSVILEAFKQKLGRLLALEVKDVHEEDAISDHGVDSLVAVEIRNWIRKEVGANVTVFEILSGKVTVKGLVETIVKEKVKA